MPIVAGVDAGTIKLGLGILDCERGRPPRYIGAETISAPENRSRFERLISIGADLREALAEYRPDCMAIEDCFVGKFPGAGIAVGEARGMVIAVAGLPGDRIFSYPPSESKAALGVSGRADKVVVSQRIKFLLRLKQSPAFDAADALAQAWTHALRAGYI